MRYVVLLALLIAPPALAQAKPGEVFKDLTGSCWRTQLDITKPDTDTHCFRETVGGAMVVDVNTVRDKDGKTTYEGVAIYQLDKASGLLRWDYYNSPGGHYVGYAKRVGDEIHFPAKPDAETPDIVWKLRPDGYDAIPSSKDGHPGKFVKLP